MTDPTDPAKALREWCALRSDHRQWVDFELIAAGVPSSQGGSNRRSLDAARALLSSAPTLLAALVRLETAEGLLREASSAMKPFAEVLDEVDSGDYDDRWAGTVIGNPKHGDESFVKLDTHLRELRAYDAARAEIAAFLAPAPASGDAEEATRGN